MENRDKVFEFQNINIIEYLNKTHKTTDNFLIETQKHNLKKYMGGLNGELYKSFVTNSDDLLEILNTYETCYSVINQFNTGSNLAGHNYTSSHEDAISVFRCKELSKKLEKFEDDLEQYLTSKRYLVTSEYFNDRRYYFVLTNDILIIGKLRDKKYKLQHIFYKRILQVTLNDGYILLKAGEREFTLSNQQDKLVDFYDLFNDTEFIEDEDEKINKTLIKYFILTEQTEKLTEYIKKYNSLEINTSANNSPSSNTSIGSYDSGSINIYSCDQLILILGISKNPTKAFSEFLYSTFESGLLKINKIQELSSLIVETFDYFYDFIKELNVLVENLRDKQINIEQYNILISIELFITRIFVSFEKRVFNKFYELKITNENLKLIEDKLVFGDYNYHYMFERLLKRKESFSLRCIELAKTEITELLNGYFE